MSEVKKIKLGRGHGALSLDVGDKGLHLVPGQTYEVPADALSQPRIRKLVRDRILVVIEDPAPKPQAQKEKSDRKEGSKDA